MRDFTRDVNCTYGAPMGRRDGHPGAEMLGRVHLRRVRLNQGGYDRGGAYWGAGMPLWYYEAEDEPDAHGYLRALHRNHAKGMLQIEHGPLKFFR